LLTPGLSSWAEHSIPMQIVKQAMSREYYVRILFGAQGTHFIIALKKTGKARAGFCGRPLICCLQQPGREYPHRKDWIRLYCGTRMASFRQSLFLTCGVKKHLPRSIAPGQRRTRMFTSWNAMTDGTENILVADTLKEGTGSGLPTEPLGRLRGPGKSPAVDHPH